MHVCFFNRSYWPDLSATGQLLTELAEDLVRVHGWDVTVVCGYPLRSEARLAASEWRHGVMTEPRRLRAWPSVIPTPASGGWLNTADGMQP